MKLSDKLIALGFASFLALGLWSFAEARLNNSGNITTGQDVILGQVTAATTTVNGNMTVNGTFSFTTGNGIITSITSTNIFTQFLATSASSSIGTSSIKASTLSVISNPLILPSLTYGDAGAFTVRSENSELVAGLSKISPYHFFLQGRTSGSVARDISINTLGGSVGIGPGSTSTVGASLVVGTLSLSTPALTYGSAANQINRFTNTELAISQDTGAPFGIWIQARTSGNAARELLLSPLGGNIGIATRMPSSSLQIGEIDNSTLSYLQIDTNPAGLPTSADCTSSTQGRMIFVNTSTQANQKLYICGRNSINTPTWASSTFPTL